jgi:multidrug resistance protein MdtO
LAHRLRVAGAVLRSRDTAARKAFEECLHEGLGEIPVWLKLAGAEGTSPARDVAALQQAARSTVVILSVVDVLVEEPGSLLPVSILQRIAGTLDGMAAILGRGGYPVEIALESSVDETGLAPLGAAALSELRTAMSAFAEPPQPGLAPRPAAKPKGGFFLPDAFTNPAHVHYALKTTGAAMFCYLVYALLDWPGIHTSLITCFIVSLDTAAETAEKQVLRFLGCGIGAAAGLAAIVFLMPNVTSIGGLMGVTFLAALASGWIAAGSPRISYAGFQLAFAFFLSVIQGAAPAFDMTIARDRTIGILFGDVVVTIVFTRIWPVTIAGRINPAIAALLRQLAALASAESTPQRWGLVADARTKLASIEQDLNLSHYEPPWIRPAGPWLDERWAVARTLSSLQGRLLIGADQDPGAFADAARRLELLAQTVGGAAGPAATAGAAAAAPGGSESTPRPAGANAILASVETSLAKLEQLVADLSDHAAPGMTDYAPA